MKNDEDGDFEFERQWYDRIHAECDLGDMYYIGDGVEQNYEEAFKCYEEVASHGNPYAQYKLGDIYYFGEGVRQNHRKAFLWYEKAAKGGYAYAQYKLGDMYYFGDGVRQNHRNAFYMYKKAAVQGDAEAQNKLGYMYYFGEGVGQDYEKSRIWYEKAEIQEEIDCFEYIIPRCLSSSYECEYECDEITNQKYRPAHNMANPTIEFFPNDIDLFKELLVQKKTGKTNYIF